MRPWGWLSVISRSSSSVTGLLMLQMLGRYPPCPRDTTFNSGGDCHPPGQGCHRTDRPPYRSRELLLNLFSSSKKDWWITSSPRPQGSKCFSKDTAFPHAEHNGCGAGHRSGRLIHFSRPEKCVFSCSSCSTFSTAERSFCILHFKIGIFS